MINTGSDTNRGNKYTKKSLNREGIEFRYLGKNVYLDFIIIF